MISTTFDMSHAYMQAMAQAAVQDRCRLEHLSYDLRSIDPATQLCDNGSEAASGGCAKETTMYRVRFKKDQHAWRFLPGRFGTRAKAEVAARKHSSTYPAVVSKHQVVMLAWYAGR
jgi:hypothetical protein